MKISVKNVCKKFKDNVVLNNVSYEFESGKIYGLVGKNGSGKTVFLKLLTGLYTPDSGKILVDGEDFNENKSYPKSMRALIENPSFISDLSGYDNLKLLASIQNKIGKKEIEEALKEVNLYDEKDKLFHKYSLGMKQKLGIAQVIMEDVDILIFDEPFSAIEDDTVEKLRDLLKKLKKEGKLIIISTHLKEDIDKLADVVLKFNNGKVTEE